MEKLLQRVCFCLSPYPAPKIKIFPASAVVCSELGRSRAFPSRDLFVCSVFVQCLATQDPVLHVFTGILLITVINNE